MAELYCFGRFTLNPDSRKLFADGVPTPVGTTSVRLLLALVEQAGQIVSKDDLMSRVWGRAAIGDNRLHVHVYELRKTIGDESIVTKSGRGYRFVPPVQRRPVQPLAAPNLLQAKAGNLPSLGTERANEPSDLIGKRGTAPHIAAP
jgi:DNA-binding winged helix-turn-helix (wHTH) protein